MPEEATPESPAKTMDAIIGELGDWRGELLAKLRDLITQAEPDVVEDIKWRKASNPLGVPVWTLDGIICTGETYKGQGQAHLRQGSFARRSSRPLQLQPRREREARHRLRRGRPARR